MNRYWIALASYEHVNMSISGGFACVAHGKKKPLEAMKSGDGLIYYSPTEIFGVKKPLQKFTALCIVEDAEPYEAEISPGVLVWKQVVDYKPTQSISVKDHLNELTFIKNKQFWGMSFRRSVFSISKEDFVHIAHHMGFELS